MTLRFGTAGLRGPVREGPDGMNVETVTRATAGLAAWLRARGEAGGTVVVGRDARHGSEAFFAATTEVLAAAGFDVVALPEPGPTPLVAFATRRLGAVAGVMITASHNPPEDNGYKVYLGAGSEASGLGVAGAQLIEPADREIEACIDAAPPARAVARRPVTPNARARRVRAQYLDRLDERFGPAVAGTVRIALTPMHGVGGALACDALVRAGFDRLHVVDEQFAPDPDFPTVAFPNPEEPGATDALLELAADRNADLAIALDPDADRCAVGIRESDGRWRMLTGDETGALLGARILDDLGLDDPGEPDGSVPEEAGERGDGGRRDRAARPVIASSIVSGTLLHRMATARGADARRTPTGFKWLVRAGEPLVFAYEEALGHCVDPEAVRDKDGISAAVALARIAQGRADRGSSLAEALAELRTGYGTHVTAQRSLRMGDPADIAALMADFRTAPPTAPGGFGVVVRDLLSAEPSIDAVELTGTDPSGSRLRIVVRPSGTEPKLKYYGELATAPGAPGTAATLTAQLTGILEELPDRPRRRNTP
ncbi:MAG: phospho-sugar mutase [Gordonia sp. (in: high G+C Gram-positive bacteria)]|uniref:phospho-sugar mutase n=1 Tax=Gordonia sp. (in: high G+C Gram-positive bacteria) TaxID=84139 RepID=UPI0039E61A96